MTRVPYPGKRAKSPPYARDGALSVVEFDVGELVSKGLSDEAIAREVGCSVGTVRIYRRKLDAQKGSKA